MPLAIRLVLSQKVADQNYIYNIANIAGDLYGASLDSLDGELYVMNAKTVRFSLHK
jgi:hypothetical protein